MHKTAQLGMTYYSFVPQHAAAVQSHTKHQRYTIKRGCEKGANLNYAVVKFRQNVRRIQPQTRCDQLINAVGCTHCICKPGERSGI